MVTSQTRKCQMTGSTRKPWSVLLILRVVQESTSIRKILLDPFVLLNHENSLHLLSTKTLIQVFYSIISLSPKIVFPLYVLLQMNLNIWYIPYIFTGKRESDLKKWYIWNLPIGLPFWRKRSNSSVLSIMYNL